MSFDLEQNQVALQNFERSEIELQLEVRIWKLLLFESSSAQISEEDWSVNDCLEDLGDNCCTCDDFHAEEVTDLEEILRAHFLEVESIWLIEGLVIFEEDLLVSIRMKEVVNTHVAFLNQMSL